MMDSLIDADSLQQILSRAGITPQRSAGQNFLVCEEPLLATVELLQTGPKAVTELGAGLGTLTVALAGSGFNVRAIERDKTLAELLLKHLSAAQRKQVEIVTEDLRGTDWSWGEPYALVGNIPYNLSGWIVRHITQLSPAPALVILLVQREVAERLTAEPPQMNLLGLAAQLWGDAQMVLQVPASCFWPEPQVDSSLVLLTASDEIELAEREHILQIAKICFQAKRKQMGGVLRRAWGAEEADRCLREAAIPSTARPQEVSVKQWQRLAKVVKSSFGDTL